MTFRELEINGTEVGEGIESQRSQQMRRMRERETGAADDEVTVDVELELEKTRDLNL